MPRSSTGRSEMRHEPNCPGSTNSTGHQRESLYLACSPHMHRRAFDWNELRLAGICRLSPRLPQPSDSLWRWWNLREQHARHRQPAFQERRRALLEYGWPRRNFREVRGEIVASDRPTARARLPARNQRPENQNVNLIVRLVKEDAVFRVRGIRKLSAGYRLRMQARL